MTSNPVDQLQSNKAQPSQTYHGLSRWIYLFRGTKRLWKRCRTSWILGILIIWASYLTTIETIATWAVRDGGTVLGHGITSQGLREQILAIEQPDSNIPSLARWDSFWFHDIAKFGYTGGKGESSKWPIATDMVENRLGFLPFYPMVMRLLAEITSMNLFAAGIWVSRISLLLSLAMLFLYQQNIGATKVKSWAPIAAILVFPSAFILVSVYTDSLFLACTLTSIVCARNGSCLPSSIAACSAVLTRINGLALIPALFVISWQRRSNGDLTAKAWVPPLSAIGALWGLCIYYYWRFNDPVAYLTAKTEIWRTKLSTPWDTFSVGQEHLERALSTNDYSSVYIYLEIPCLLLIALSVAYLVSEKLWSEAVFVGLSALMTLVAGTLWGLPRFTIFLFPAFILIARLQRYPALWYSYLLCSALLQTCILINFVKFDWPAP